MADAVTSPTVPGYVNRLVKGLLRSPLHRLLSRNTMLLTYTGRKTGKRYVVAVRYVRGADLITCFTDSRWWINLRDRAPVQMLIAGETVQGIATPVEDHKTVETGLLNFLNTTPGDSKYYGVRRDADGKPRSDDIHNAAEYTTMIQIRLQP